MLKKQRENLRKKNESTEGVQYRRNCGKEMGEYGENIPHQLPAAVDIEILNLSSLSEDCQLVFFDLETSGLKKTADILQIAAKCGDRSFTVYINPTQSIDESASEVTGLKNIAGTLFHNGNMVESIPLHHALLAFLEFINITLNPTVLVAHNASFDVPRLFQAITNCSMIENFSCTAGYTDTLPILRKSIPTRKGERMFKLSTLANDLLNITSSGGFHEALYDVKILEQVLETLNIGKKAVLANAKCFFESLIHPTLVPLIGATSKAMIKKISNASITYGMIEKEYSRKGDNGIIQLLSQGILGDKKPRVTKDRKTLNKIIAVFQK